MINDILQPKCSVTLRMHQIRFFCRGFAPDPNDAPPDFLVG